MNAFTKAVTEFWRNEGKYGVIFFLILASVTACLLALVIKSDFSNAIWGNGRESALFVMVGLAAFGGVILCLICPVYFFVRVLKGWYDLARSSPHERLASAGVLKLNSPVGTTAQDAGSRDETAR